MKRLSLMMVAGLLAAGATACFDDPVSDLRGAPDRIQFSVNYIVMNVGDTQRVDIKLYDAQGGSLPFAAPTYASAAPTIADAEPFPDTTIVTLPNSDYWKSVVIGKGPGSTKIAVTAGGITDSLTVLVFPVTFGGAITPTPVAEGAEVTIAATSNVGFRTNSVVTVDGLAVFQTGSSATQLKFIATPAGADRTVRITNLLLLGQYSVAALDASTPLTVTNANEPGNDDPATTAQSFTPPAAVGDSVMVFGSIADDDLNDYWKFTVGTAGSYQVRIFWPASAADVDGNLLDAAGAACIGSCSAMWTSADPETVTAALSAATTYQLLVSLYDAHGVAMPHPYRITVKRIS